MFFLFLISGVHLGLSMDGYPLISRDISALPQGRVFGIPVLICATTYIGSKGGLREVGQSIVAKVREPSNQSPHPPSHPPPCPPPPPILQYMKESLPELKFISRPWFLGSQIFLGMFHYHRGSLYHNVQKSEIYSFKYKFGLESNNIHSRKASL